jgi:hypothetical protein
MKYYFAIILLIYQTLSESINLPKRILLDENG